MSVQIGAPTSGEDSSANQHSQDSEMAGNISLVPAGSWTVFEADAASTSVRFCFTSAVLDKTAVELGVEPHAMELVAHQRVHDKQIEHLAGAVGNALAFDSPLSRLYAESLGTALLSRVVKRFFSAKTGDAPIGLSKWQLQRVIDYIEDFLDEAITLKELAAVAGLSTSYFGTQFRRSMGIPVHQYVIRRRVERAKALLMQGRTISQAAFDAGFSDQSHLARCMRRVLGLSPANVSRLATPDPEG